MAIGRHGVLSSRQSRKRSTINTCTVKCASIIVVDDDDDDGCTARSNETDCSLSHLRIVNGE
jgi:hypothetical protein